jgi:phosphatidylserine/phosphatidylglycerophosphate/cardiolipin synthase-like enzyme
MAVEGDAARALGDLARQRWQTATGEEHRPVPPGSACWPPDLAPDLVGTEVAIARTRPPQSGRATRREAALLNRAALTGARRSIYIEAQYFASSAIARILARRLREPEGPDVVIVVTASSRGLLERLVMGANRNRLIRRLKRADRSRRLRVMYAVVPGKDGAEQEVLNHSKLVVVDDRFLRIGSSNLNNRSEGLDTECDLAIEARNEEESRAIAALRERLLAEHLASRPETVRSIVAESRSLLQAIDRLNTRPRGLRPLRTGPGGTGLLLGTGLLDPKRPWWPMQWLFRPLARWINKVSGGS